VGECGVLVQAWLGLCGSRPVPGLQPERPLQGCLWPPGAANSRQAGRTRPDWLWRRPVANVCLTYFPLSIAAPSVMPGVQQTRLLNLVGAARGGVPSE
jgi:hypothetical protein